MATTIQKTAATILLDCGFPPGGGSQAPCANGAEWAASARLADESASTANLILAARALLCDQQRTIGAFSRASASTDAARRAEKEARRPWEKQEAEIDLRRAVRLEEEALEALESPNPGGTLLRRLLDVLAVRGIAEGSVRHLADQIRSGRGMRAAISRHQQGCGGLAEGVPTLLTEIIEDLRSHGVTWM